jgi:quercetin dioxygenase-like cupin family protein
MNTPQFMELLLQEGFPDPIEVQQVPNGHLGNHEHPFEVIALVIEGSINITIDGLSKVYGVGDIFRLDFKQPHSESYGPDGVKYLASRKH